MGIEVLVLYDPFFFHFPPLLLDFIVFSTPPSPVSPHRKAFSFLQVSVLPPLPPPPLPQIQWTFPPIQPSSSFFPSVVFFRPFLFFLKWRPMIFPPSSSCSSLSSPPPLVWLVSAFSLRPAVLSVIFRPPRPKPHSTPFLIPARLRGLFPCFCKASARRNHPRPATRFLTNSRLVFFSFCLDFDQFFFYPCGRGFLHKVSSFPLVSSPSPHPCTDFCPLSVCFILLTLPKQGLDGLDDFTLVFYPPCVGKEFLTCAPQSRKVFFFFVRVYLIPPPFNVLWFPLFPCVFLANCVRTFTGGICQQGCSFFDDCG